MQDVLEFTFSSKAEAEHALEKANEKKAERQPGEVMRINLNDGQQEPDENGAFWMVVNDDGEWMVNRDGSWVCVA
jgi:hypothetical protein